MIEFLLLFASGSLITLSLAPFYWWPLSLVALAVLHLALQKATPRQAIWRSSYFGLGLLLSGLHWIYVSMHEHGGASPLLGSIMTLGLCLFLASWFMPLGYAYVQWLRPRKGGTTLGFAAIWVISEWLRTWLLTGFPWLFVGYTQLDGPLHSWAPVAGTLGISFIMAYSVAALMQSLLSRKPTWHLAAVLLLWLAALPLAGIEWTRNKHTPPLTVALLQPDIDIEDKWNPVFREPMFNYFREVTQQQTADLVVWPETALPTTYDRALDYLRGIDNEARSKNQAVALGIASRWEKDGRRIYHNSVLAIGEGNGFYHKQMLVPFGEFIPLEDWLRGLIEFFDLPMSQFSPGPEQQEALLVKNLLVMPYICYEIVYPAFVAASAGKSDILLTISNDAWFGTSIGPVQHMQIARMRALETGRYLIRDTNNGITAIIDADGQVVKQLPQFRRGLLTGEVYAREGLTPVSRYGTLPAILLCFIVFGLVRLAPQSLNPEP